MKFLCWFTVGLTYLLMVWGNIVSATGSGLACPDWPLCHGSITPPASLPVFLEWGHRVLAFTTTLFIFFTLYRSFISKHLNPFFKKKLASFLIIQLFIQIGLGGITVFLGLSPWVSTIHLVIALSVFSSLILLASKISWNDQLVPSDMLPKAKRLSIFGLFGLLIQMILGGLTRHNHSGLACPNFPECLDSFFPDPLNWNTFLAFTHRWWGVLMLGLFFHLAILTSKKVQSLKKLGRSIFGLAASQVILGVGTVLSGLSPDSRSIHAAIGYALWGFLIYFSLRTGVAEPSLNAPSLHE